MVIVTRLTADPDFEKNNAFRGATTQSWGLPEGLGIPDFRDGNGISISTDYYHGLLSHRVIELSFARIQNGQQELGVIILHKSMFGGRLHAPPAQQVRFGLCE